MSSVQPPGSDPTLRDSEYGCVLILGRQAIYLFFIVFVKNVFSLSKFIYQIINPYIFVLFSDRAREKLLFCNNF